MNNAIDYSGFSPDESKEISDHKAVLENLIKKDGFVVADDIHLEEVSTLENEGYKLLIIPAEDNNPRYVKLLAEKDAIFGNVLRAFYRDQAAYNSPWKRYARGEISYEEALSLKGEPVEPAYASEKSTYQKTMDDIVEDQIKYRQAVFEHLMNDPGFLATLGDDFIIEFGDMKLTYDNPITSNPLDVFNVNFSQTIRFSRNTQGD